MAYLAKTAPGKITSRAFESTVIIFKPNSTGDAAKLAEQLRFRLGNLLPHASDVRLQPTSQAGPAVELARDAAGAGGPAQRQQLRSQPSKPIPYQIDKEVKSVEAHTLVTIECAPAALATLG